jgi:acyl-CoA synthetase (AMP-forming)/AMP-acid ligase II
MTNDARLAESFHVNALAEPDEPALIVGDETWTRRQLHELADRATTVLLERGVEPGGTVVSQYATRCEDIAVALAASRLGCTFIPIPVRMGPYEVGYVLGLARPQVFAVRDAAFGDGLNELGGAQLVTLDAIRSASPTAFGECAPANDVAVIGFTSGTTGRPKGVMHSHESLSWTAERMRALADIRPDESIVVTGAGAGAPGFAFFTYLPLVRGITVVHAERWNPSRILELIERHRCVWTVMVPTMLYQLIEAQAESSRCWDVSSVRAITVGGAFMSEDLIKRSREVLGWEVLRMYAMSECMAHSSMELTDSVQARTELDGRPGPNSEFAAFGLDGLRLPDGEVGEMGFKGPSLLLGYLGEPDGKRSQMTPDDFFLSGDLGRVTANGAAKIVGRIKDMIIRGGFNIDPSEVEGVARKHRSIQEVAVVGYPDERFGERACAVVTLRPEESIDHAQLIDYLLSLGLSKEKLPEHLLVVDQMPTSPDGKLLKRQLADLVVSDLGLEALAFPHSQTTLS